MTHKELQSKFGGKMVSIKGRHPGHYGVTYDFGNGEFVTAWDVQGDIGFSACGCSWPRISRWEEKDNRLFGYYTSPNYQDRETTGFVIISLAN